MIIIGRQPEVFLSKPRIPQRKQKNVKTWLPCDGARLETNNYDNCVQQRGGSPRTKSLPPTQVTVGGGGSSGAYGSEIEVPGGVDDFGRAVFDMVDRHE